MSTQTQPLTRLRSSLANAAWAVEDRVILGGGDLLRGIFDVVKWPFERVAWGVERWVVWPLEERAGAWGRGAGIALVSAVTIGAVAAGLLWATSGDGGGSTARQKVAPVAAPTLPVPEQSAPAEVLRGTAPVFKPEADGGVAKPAGGEAIPAPPEPSTAPSTPSAIAPPAVPAATKVARRFAGAFVLYETGKGGDEVRAIFRETATPQLARALLRRPPRLPASGKVPQAKVLNVVAGPARGATLTLSASLLRVGVTSELRIDVQKTEDGPRVTSVLG
ncbi:MAG TPA: hypothetical protein VNM89_06760 [Solirubrobacterales bacterium]|nr:hypothetical protein [Solirubrobacterales bacterium]